MNRGFRNGNDSGDATLSQFNQMDISPAERLTGANIDSPGAGCVYGAGK